MNTFHQINVHINRIVTSCILVILLIILGGFTNASENNPDNLQPSQFSDLVLWLDASDSSTVYTDTMCSSSVTDKNAVACWKDKSGQNNHVFQDILVDRPTYLLNEQNRKPALDFVNSKTENDDWLQTRNSGQITARGPYTKFVVFKYDDLNASNNLVSSKGSGSVLWGSSSFKGKLHVWNPAGPIKNPGFMSAPDRLSNTKYYIASVRYDNIPDDNTLSILKINGSEVDSDDTLQNHSVAPITIGNHVPLNTALNGLDGKIAEVLVYNRGLSDLEISCIEAYLGDKWDISTESECKSTITLDKTNYPQYKVFQRDELNQYDFALSGTYFGSCGEVEASFDDGPYVTIDADLFNGLWSGTLSDRGIGQGKLSVRCKNNPSVEDSINDIGVGDVYVIAGQSNAAGRAETLQNYLTVAPMAQVFPTVYTDDDDWKVANDPTDPYANGRFGSVWPIVGGYIVEKTGIPVQFIATADGGRGLVDRPHWTKGGGVNCSKNIPCFDNMINQVNEVAPNSVKAILWFQGEADANKGVSRSTYSSALSKFISDAQTDLPGEPDLVVGVIGPWMMWPDNATQIRLGIQDAWNDINIKHGPQTYDIHIINDGNVDNAHFRTDDEIQTLAFRWWKALEEHYYGGGEGVGRGPVVISAQLLPNKYHIDVRFKTNSPLQGGTSIDIWSVDDGGISRTVKSVELIGTDKIRLTLDALVTSNNVKLTYAKGNSGENKSVLTDSTTGNTASGTSPLPADVFSDYPVILVPR